MTALKVGDVVTVCPTYRGFASQSPKVNGVIRELGSIGSRVVFNGWAGGWQEGPVYSDGDCWHVPNKYLKSVIQLPDSTASADEATPEPKPVATLYPSDLIILKHLKARKSISAMEALVTHGCPRLAPRIFNLRAAGWDITTSYHHDAMGHRYTRYTLKGDAA